MWSKGYIRVGCRFVKYEMKRYDKPSMSGIENGRISKLTIWMDGKIVLNYDRGWDLTGQGNKTARAALEKILNKYN